MTTLPQTTSSLALPRPVGAPGLPMTMPGGFAPSQAQQAAGLTGSDIWRVIRANLWLIIGSLIVALIVGYLLNLYLAKYYSRYTATGLVQIQQIKPFNLTGVQQGGGMDELNSLVVEQRSQSQMMHTDELFTRVLSDPNAGIRNTEWFKQFKKPDGSMNLADAKDDLGQKFAANPIGDSKLIQVTFSYKIPEDCKQVVLDLVNQHINNESKRNHDRVYSNQQTLSNLRQRYEQRISDLRKDTSVAAASLQLDGYGRPGGIGVVENNLSSLISMKLKAESELAMAKSASDNVGGQIARGETPAAVEIMVNQQPLVMTWKQRVQEYEVQIRSYDAQSSDSKNMKTMIKQRDAAQNMLDEVRAEERANNTAEYRDKVDGELTQAQAQVDGLNKQIQQINDKLGEMTETLGNYLTKKDEEDNYQELLKRIRDQLDMMQNNVNWTEMNAVTWASQPEKPETPSFPQLPVTLAVCGAVALALSLGLSFIREMLDTTVKSPRDIQRVGQMSLLGMIPHESDDPQAAGVPLSTVIYGAPTSMIAEQFRQVRTRLQHAASLDTTRSILVTSPGPEDGKSTVACNLAAGLALNGRKILLVDANFRRPELHKIFGVGNESGFGSVLTALDDFPNAIKQTKVPNLDLMTAGPKLANATELLESQLLIDFIERALEDYDHVVFDSGPMLVVSETVALAPRVDGVVTVVRARSNSRGLLTRMRDTLRQLKAEHLGVVLNGVRSTGGGYYGRNIKTYYEYQNTQT